MFTRSSLSKNLISAALLSVILMGLFGVYHMGMTMSMDGKMSDCPFSPGTSLCAMSPLDHIGAAENMLLALPQQNGAFLFILVLVLGMAALADIFSRSFSPPKLLYERRSRFEHEEISPRGFLQEAFSNGILNPKTF